MAGDVVIVGAGPAGLRAAERLVAGGLEVTIVHEGESGGGNIYRRQPRNFRRSPETIYASEAGRARAIHALYDRLHATGRTLGHTSVLGFESGALLCEGEKGLFRLPAPTLMIATGASDTILPLPGWTLPGAYTLGAAQIALKSQGCVIGNRIVFFGTGPLLYLVAWQYLHAGAQVAAVCDTSRWWDKARQAPGMLWEPRALWLGLRYRRELHRHGVALHEGIQAEQILGGARVGGFRFRDNRGHSHDVACDAVGFGYGLRPETRLAELAGARLSFDPVQVVWNVAEDGHGRIAPGVYGAGDGIAVLGADAAEAAGHLAALSVLADIGRKVDALELKAISARLARFRRFRRALDRAFPPPSASLAALPDDTVLCRCETVTIGEARAAITAFAPDEVNRLKALCRTGMGRCQGRVCGLATARLLAEISGCTPGEVGTMRTQAPLKPVSYAAAATLATTEIRQAIEASFSEKTS